MDFLGFPEGLKGAKNPPLFFRMPDEHPLTRGWLFLIDVLRFHSFHRAFMAV